MARLKNVSIASARDTCAMIARQTGGRCTVPAQLVRLLSDRTYRCAESTCYHRANRMYPSVPAVVLSYSSFVTVDTCARSEWFSAFGRIGSTSLYRTLPYVIYTSGTSINRVSIVRVRSPGNLYAQPDRPDGAPSDLFFPGRPVFVRTPSALAVSVVFN